MKSSYLAFKSTGYSTLCLCIYISSVNSGNGSSQILFTCSSVCDDDHIVEKQCIIFYDDIDVCLVTNSHIRGLVTDRGYNQDVPTCSLYAENTVQVSNNADVGTLYLNTRSSNGIALCIDNLSGYHRLGESLHSYHKKRKRNHNETFYHKQC